MKEGEKMNFNVIQLNESEGKGKIKIDETEIKGLTKYEIKRGIDVVDLTFSISIPNENFKTI